MINRHSASEAVQKSAPSHWSIAVALAASLATAGFLVAGQTARGAARGHATVSLRATKLGTILVDSRGRTLYLFARDRNGRSSCTGACATNWPPLTVALKPRAGSGIRRSLLGTTMRTDGRKQVTYNRHPLYTFAFDHQAGQTSGQGVDAFGARWWALSATGDAIKKTASITTPTPTTTTTTTTGTTTTSPYGYQP